MATSDSFSDAINKGIAEMRSVLADAAGRFESEARKIADTVNADDRLKSERMKAAGDQLHSVVEMLRTEATRAASQFSDGINEAVEDVRDFVQDNVPGASPSAKSDEPSATGAAKKTATKKAAAKKTATSTTAKKTASKKAAKKATAKKPTAKTAKKATAKKTATKKAAKKATAKKPAAKKTAKKTAAKKTAKKSATKKAAKKTPKKSSAKKAAKKSTGR